jgi:hypothetical protein
MARYHHKDFRHQIHGGVGLDAGETPYKNSDGGSIRVSVDSLCC